MSDVWNNRLDGRYRASVDQDAVLTIVDEDNDNDVIYSEQDKFTYEPRFGPDVEDVARWQSIVVDFIDNEYNSLT